MKNIFIYLLLSSFLFISCDKRVLDYSQIELENNKGKIVHVNSLDGKLLVFTFLSPECPLSENYTRTLIELEHQFEKKEVHFYYVFPGIFYPRPQIEQFTSRYKLPENRILYDPNYRLLDYCKATTTPESFLIDDFGVIQYSGAIDNWAITLGRQRQIVSENYLKDAIEDVLKGREVKISNTRAVGCIIE